MARAEAYLRTKWHLDPSSPLDTINMGRKVGTSAPIFWGEPGPHLTQCCLGRGRPPYQLPSGIWIHLAVWPQHTWAKNRGRGCTPFGGAGSSFNIMWPGPRPTFIPSGILIHPTVWPLYTNVTDRTNGTGQDRTGQTDNGPIAYENCFTNGSPKIKATALITDYYSVSLPNFVRVGRIKTPFGLR